MFPLNNFEIVTKLKCMAILHLNVTIFIKLQCSMYDNKIIVIISRNEVLYRLRKIHTLHFNLTEKSSCWTDVILYSRQINAAW